MLIAMPDSDMMFDGMSSSRMKMNEISTAIGNVMQMMSALRACQSTSRITALATSISSRTACVTVSIALSIRRVRS